MRNLLIVEGWMTQLLGLLLIAALLSARAQAKANRLLAAVLFCAAYRQFLIAMRLSGAIESFPALLRSAFPFQILAISLLYLYAKAITTPEFKFEWRQAVHLIPFAAATAWCLYDDREYAVQVAVKLLVAIPYLLQAQRQVRHFIRQSKDHLSDISHLRLTWLRMLLVAVYVMMGVDVLDVVTGPNIPVWYLVPSVGLISLTALAFYSLRVSPVFAREAEARAVDLLAEAGSPPDQKKDMGRLSEEQLERQKERLIDLLSNKGIYLNPELRLSDLAKALGIRPYRVSEILSRGLETSFYDLINRYRVAKAQDLLMAPDSAHLNLLGVAMESGFKSKSVFNDVFKKTTGKTPSQFRAAKMTESVRSDT